jgi:hypothetical protein
MIFVSLRQATSRRGGHWGTDGVQQSSSVGPIDKFWQLST